MLAFFILEADPAGDDSACFSQACEPVLVQTLVAQSSVEASRYSSLDRLARLDEGELDRVLFGPQPKSELMNSGPLSTTIDSGYPPRSAAISPSDESPSPSDESPSVPERETDLLAERLPGAVVDDVERSELPSVRERISDEVHRPPHVRADRNRSRNTRSSQLPSRSFSRLQSFFAVDAMNAFVIDPRSIPSELPVQPPIAVTRRCRGHGPEAAGATSYRRRAASCSATSTATRPGAC